MSKRELGELATINPKSWIRKIIASGTIMKLNANFGGPFNFSTSKHPNNPKRLAKQIRGYPARNSKKPSNGDIFQGTSGKLAAQRLAVHEPPRRLQ
jgi:hypothetical protein